MINNKFLNDLSNAVTAYSDYFMTLSDRTIQEPATPEINEFSAEELGKAVDETLLESDETVFADFGGVFRAAKVGYTLLKINKEGPTWAAGSVRGGYRSNI